MPRTSSKVSAWIVVTAILLATRVLLAVDVTIDFDKSFNFKAVRTWAWSTGGPGEVKVARTPQDDPEAARKQAEPVIMSAVETEMGKRGLQPNAVTPDIHVTYYLLLTTGSSAQTIGQFLPATTQWGIPPFLPSTQSLEVMNQGALVLDLSKDKTVVWRGVAQSQIRMGTELKKREALIREAVNDLIRRFPPKS